MYTLIITDAPIFAAIRAVGGPLTQRDVYAVQGALAQAAQLRDDKPIFDVARVLDDDGDGLSQHEVDLIDTALRAARAGHPCLPPVVRGRQVGDAGLALIQQFEGCKLVAYLCPAHVWTVGYGHTGPDVHPGMAITQAEADSLLRDDLDRFEHAVDLAAPGAPQAMFDAMVALAFNIGVGAFLKSSVLRLHKAGDHRRAAEAFGLWNKGGGRVLAGLVRRRAAEAELYRRGM